MKGGVRPRDYIEAILDRELKLTLRGVELGSERDDSMRSLTETAATLYDGRILRELIQNAYDGSGGHPSAEIVVRLDLSAGSHGVLDVANSGDGFGRDDVDSIVNPARSRKRPGNSIGHKGLGFRSVTLISRDPQVYSRSGSASRESGGFDGFCFRFASEEAQRERLLKLAPSDLAEQAVGKTHSLQLPLAIGEPPAGVQRYAEAGYATLVRLPLIDAVAAERMEREWQALFDERSPLTLFLTRLSKLTIEKIGPDGALVSRELVRRPRAARDLPKIPGLTVQEIEADGQMFLFASRSLDRPRFLAAVERAVGQRHKVEKWRDWEGEPTVSVAVPLASEASRGRYYAFLPMETSSPFNGYLDAPFFPDPDRRGLRLDNALNDELVDVAAEICVALLTGFAAANVTRAAHVHAAVDAVTWSDHDRIFGAADRMAVERAKLPLPVVRRPDSDARWSTLDSVFDWPDQDCRSLSAVWLAKVTGDHLLRRGMGTRRVEALRALADEADLPLEPDAARLAGWIPALAADLGRQRKATARQWQDFYADLAERPKVLELLKGQSIFRNEARRIVRAEGALLEDGRPIQFFINADPGRAVRKKKRLDDAGVFPPACITKGMEFADPTLSWPSEVVEAFVGAGLASEFRLVRVVSRIGTLLDQRPRKRDALQVLGWAFRSWRDHRSPEFDKALAKANLWVPLAEGGIDRAGSAYFSRGWRDTLGDPLSELCGEAPQERQIAAVARRLLPSWPDWQSSVGDGAQDWRDFLKLAGVRDGLPWYRTAEVRMQWFHWTALRRGTLEPRNFERELGGHWRSELARSPSAPTYVSGQYVTTGVPYLCAQARHDALSGPAKLVYGRLVAHALARLPDEALTVTIRREGKRSEAITWPSPILGFLRNASWVPASGSDDFDGLRIDQCWLGGRNEVPRFVRRIERTAKDVIDGSERVRRLLADRLGMPTWADQASAPRRIAALGEMLQAGILDAHLDEFRKATREAWSDYARLSPRPPLPSSMVLPVDTRTGLRPLVVAKSAPAENPLFVDDGSRPMFQQVLVSLGHGTLEVPQAAAGVCIDALARDLACRAQLIREDALSIEVDGVAFAPSGEDPLLVRSDREWIADVAVLVLEVSSTLTNQNTQRARQALADAVRRVRLRFVQRISVAVDAGPVPLPPELGGVLPIPDGDRPTIIVEADGLGWTTLSRIAAALPLAIGRPALADSFRLIFVALENEMARGGLGLRPPADVQLARALGRPVSRVVELLRSLRATTPRLLEFLVPLLHANGRQQAASALLERADRLTDDADVVSALVHAGVTAAEAGELVARCRDADTLNSARRDLGVGLADLNASLVALHRAPLSFAGRLGDRFSARLEQRRGELERLVRDAHRATVEQDGGLARYTSDLSLDWVAMPGGWVETLDDVDADTVDGEIDGQVRARIGGGPFPSGPAPDGIRQHNRQLLVGIAEELRRLVRAFARKASLGVPEIWLGPTDALGRGAVSSGALDFDQLDADGLVRALARAGVWPSGMPITRSAAELGLEPGDLLAEEEAERRRSARQQQERRSLRFGEKEIDGGADGWFDRVAEAMAETLEGRSFRERSGPARLQPFGPAEPPRRRGPGGRTRAEDPQYLSQEQRDLIGFAGELAAYRYLCSKHRNARPEHWVSSMGRRYLGLAPMADQGFDFRVSDGKGFVHYEVKAHTGDPGYVDLERSQVTAAVSMRGEGANRWRILYVANVRTSAVIVLELPNPYTDESARLFRDSHRQGVRLAVRRA